MMTRQEEILRHFARFHRANPSVWSRFCHHAQRLIIRGCDHYSSRTLISVIRFERDLSSRDFDTGLRVNDHFSPYYARMWALQHPSRPEFFSQRKLISKQCLPRGRETRLSEFSPDVPDVDLDVFLKSLLQEEPTT